VADSQPSASGRGSERRHALAHLYRGAGRVGL